MAYGDVNELIETAREFFIAGDYKRAEPLLSQALLQNNRNPELFQMLATIYYDQGKFSKAIKTFKRALEIDPTYTDASVGLSIILNDLGKYEEGRKIFEDAQKALNQNKTKTDPYIESKLALKHQELGDLYFQYHRYDEAAEQYYKALKLSTKKTDITMKIVECFVQKPDYKNAVRELKGLLRDFPQFGPARIKLGIVYYNQKQVADAVEQWEGVLLRDPENPEVQNYIKIAQARSETALS